MNRLFACIFALSLITGPYVFADDAKPETPAVTEKKEAPKAEEGKTKTEETKVPDVSEVEENVSEHIEKTVEAFQLGNWGPAVGLAIMLLVWFLVSFLWTTFPSVALPWLSAGLGIVSAVATDLIAGRPWWKALLSGLTMGAAASGFWSMLGKYILEAIKKPGHKSKSKEEPNEEKEKTE